MAEDNRLNLVEGTGINLAKDDQARTLTIKTTVNNVELTSPNESINIQSSVNTETNTKTFTLNVVGGGETGENTVLESPNNSINITSAYDAQTNTRTFNIDVNGGGGTGENTVLQSQDNTINITSAYDVQTNTRTFDIGVNGGLIDLQSEDHSLNISESYDRPNNKTTFDLSVIPQQSDWAETDSNSGTFIQHKPIEIVKYPTGAYSAITNALNAGKLVMTDRGHVYSKTENNVHYFTKLDYVENEDYPTHYDKANYEIVTVSGDHDWILNHVGGALITNDFIDYAFADPIWDKNDFWGQPSIRLKECPLYRYSYIDEHNNEQYNLDIPGQTEVTIQNNKLIVIRDINQPTLDIILYLTHNHVPNFVIETSPNTDCDVTIKATYNSQTEPSPMWETLYHSNGATSATIISGHYYQIKATGSYWSMTDYGTNGRLWNS